MQAAQVIHTAVARVAAKLAVPGAVWRSTRHIGPGAPKKTETAARLVDRVFHAFIFPTFLPPSLIVSESPEIGLY